MLPIHGKYSTSTEKFDRANLVYNLLSLKVQVVTNELEPGQQLVPN